MSELSRLIRVTEMLPELAAVPEPPPWLPENYRRRLLDRTYDIDETSSGLLADLLK